MADIREIVSKNLITLRKRKGMTQVDLSKRINYSDKAVSRWEKGEVLPDIETLQNLSKVFDVPLTYMLEEHNHEKEIVNKPSYHEIMLHITSICSIWIFATVLFVYLKLIYSYTFWQAFVWGVPPTILFTLFANRKWGNAILKTVLQSVLLWAVITCFYLQFLTQNLWLIFLIGIPVQIAIILKHFTKPKMKDF